MAWSEVSMEMSSTQPNTEINSHIQPLTWRVMLLKYFKPFWIFDTIQNVENVPQVEGRVGCVLGLVEVGG